MKRKRDGDLVLMGQLPGNTKKRFNLFDGKFTTGYKIKSFKIVDYAMTASYECMGVLSTTERSVSALTDWADVEQVAWAQYLAPTTNTTNEFTVRPDSIILEDLYLDVYATNDNRLINYQIILEKYEFTAWDGAGNMVRNQSQSGPSA